MWLGSTGLRQLFTCSNDFSLQASCSLDWGKCFKALGEYGSNPLENVRGHREMTFEDILYGNCFRSSIGILVNSLRKKPMKSRDYFRRHSLLKMLQVLKEICLNPEEKSPGCLEMTFEHIPHEHCCKSLKKYM